MIDQNDGENPPPRLSIVSLAATAAIAGLIVFGMLALVISMRSAAPPPAPEVRTEAPREKLPTVAQQTARMRITSFAAGIEPFDPLGESTTAVQGFAPIVQLNPPYEAQESTTFDARGTRWRLGWVTSVRRSGVCLSADNLKFACGLQSRASLQSMMRGRGVTCVPLFDPHAGAGESYADCFVEGRNLAVEQVRAGYAFPSVSVASPALDEAFEAAKTAAVGIWNGGNRVVGGSEDNDRLPPTQAPN